MSSFNRTLLVIACMALIGGNAKAMVINPHPLPSFSEILSKDHSAGRSNDVARANPPEVQSLMAFGAAAVFLMLLCKFHEPFGRGFAIATIVFGLMASAYGFLQGAWPLGIAMGAYSIGRLRACLPSRQCRRKQAPSKAVVQEWQKDRMERLFGPMSEV